MAFSEFLVTELRENYDPLVPTKEPLKSVIATKKRFEELLQENKMKKGPRNSSENKWRNVQHFEKSGNTSAETARTSNIVFSQTVLNRILVFIGDVKFLSKCSQV